MDAATTEGSLERSSPPPKSRETSRKIERKALGDLKHLVESSKIIDAIFKERSVSLERERKAEQDRIAKEKEDQKELVEANEKLKDSLMGKGSGAS